MTTEESKEAKRGCPQREAERNRRRRAKISFCTIHFRPSWCSVVQQGLSLDIPMCLVIVYRRLFHVAKAIVQLPCCCTVMRLWPLSTVETVAGQTIRHTTYADVEEGPISDGRRSFVPWCVRAKEEKQREKKRRPATVFGFRCSITKTPTKADGQQRLSLLCACVCLVVLLPTSPEPLDDDDDDTASFTQLSSVLF